MTVLSARVVNKEEFVTNSLFDQDRACHFSAHMRIASVQPVLAIGSSAFVIGSDVCEVTTLPLCGASVCALLEPRSSLQCLFGCHGGGTWRAIASAAASPLLTPGQQASVFASRSSRTGSGAWPGISELTFPLPGISTGLRCEGRSGEMGLREGGGALRADSRTGSAPYRVLVVPEERKGNMYVFVVSVPSGG